MASQQSVTPSTNTVSNYRIPVYIPNNAISIYRKKKTLLYLELRVYSMEKKDFVSDIFQVGFKAKKKKSCIETFDL